MEVVGKVHLIGAEQQVSATFVKRELVVVTDEQYPQYISINFVQDKTELLDRFKKGDDITVGINLRGKEWVNPEGVSKYFNDIQGWKITANNPQSGTTNPNVNNAQTQINPKEYPQANQPNSFVDDSNDLPF